ncbi:hypothetical protein [Aurantiacibacter zhengii]|uniref:DUF2306 domain-containing protein n=1 Tax=Aurantiacibacter zhengii TaxID=2307003 RepID=A0A418NWV4_9SPHN|nr:hypothetical protein [Aurantiacibacter zhengii]RIV89093.1 hypothetical protein D2V07_02255 [Aurantiacibacter zhengii]
MTRIARERWLHFALAVFISGCVYWGFFYTYIGPWIAAGPAQELSLAVHVHGVSFLAWYALLFVQASLAMARSMKLHRLLGYASIALVIVMVGSGMLVLGVRMRAGLGGSEPFWASFSLAILSGLLLFGAYYVLALLRRNRPSEHRRLIVIAAATGSGAAIFRIFMVNFGFSDTVTVLGILATNLFIVAAAVGDKAITGKVHRTYKIGLAVALSFEIAMLGLALTEPGVALQRAIVRVLEPALVLAQ